MELVKDNIRKSGFYKTSFWKQKVSVIVFVLACFLFFTPTHAFAANRYWVGATDGANTNTTASWSSTASSACNTNTGASVPGVSDIAIFESDCTNGATIDANINVAGISILSGYSGTITQSSTKTVTVGSSHYSQSGGTFTGSNGAITINGNYTLSGGTFTSTSGTLTVNGNVSWTHTAGGTFNHNNGTIVSSSFNGSLTWDVATNETLNNLTITTSSGGGTTISSGDTLIVLGTLTHSNGAINTGTIEAQGNVIVGASAQGGNGTISFLVAGDQTITSSGGSTAKLNINKASGTVNVTGDLGITGFTLASSGTGAFTSTSGTLTVNGNTTWTHTAGGTFNHNNGTIVSSSFNGSLTWDVATNETLNNLTITTSSGGGTTISSGDTLIVLGTLTHSNGAINTGTIEAQGNVIVGASAQGGNGTISFLVAGDQTITSTSGTLPNLNINKPSGTVSVTGDLSINGFTLSSGTFTSTSGTLSVGGNWTHTAGGTFNHNNGTVVVSDGGSSNYPTYDFASSETFYNFTTNRNSYGETYIASGDTLIVLGTFTLNYGSVYTGTIEVRGNVVVGSTARSGGTAAINFTGSNAQTLTLTSGGVMPTGLITINKTNSTDTVTLASNVTLGGALTVTKGVFDQGATYNLTTGGAVTVSANGTWSNTGTGDVTLAGNVSNSGIIILDANGNGCGGNDDIVLTSTASAQRTWSGAGTFILEDLAVSWMAGTETTYSSTNSGNNSNWTFSAGCLLTVSGTVYSDEGSTALTTTPTVRVKVNGSGTYSGTANVSGVYTVPGVTVASAGDVVTTYLDGATEKSVTVTRAVDATSNISGLNLYKNYVIVRHEDSGPTTNTNLDQYDSGNDSDIQFTVTSGALTVASGNTLYIWTGKTFTPGGDATTPGLKILGTYNNSSSNPSLTITGNLAINSGGTFTKGTATTTFYGKTTQSWTDGNVTAQDLGQVQVSGGFSYSHSITLDHTKAGSSDSTNFPVLIDTTNASTAVKNSLKSTGNGGNVQSANGYDIYFYSDSALTTRLPAERVTYDATTGIGEWWVNVPTVSHTSDTVIYIAYGDSGISSDPNSDGTYGTTSTWDSNFKSVYHLPNGSSLSVADSTGNDNGTNNGVAATTGQIDGGGLWAENDSFSGSVTSNSTNTTLEAWVYRTGDGGASVGRILQDNFGVALILNNGSDYMFRRAWSGSNAQWAVARPSINVWHHVVVTYNSSSATNDPIIYIDGTAQSLTVDTNSSGSVNSFSAGYTFGNNLSGGGRVWSGSLDEFRISDSIRSADWILTEYNNQLIPDKNADAGGFYTMGSETSVNPTTLNLGSSVKATSVQIDSSQTLSANGSNTLSLTGNGSAVFVKNGTFTPSTGTVSFDSSATTGTTVPAITYYNLTLNKGNNYSYSRSITINHTKVPNTDQTNFPVLVDLTDSNLQANALSNGNDILFTSSDGTTKIPYEREIYTTSTGRLTAWVKVPTVATASDTVIYMYYGNAGASDQQDAVNTWDSNYVLVMHGSRDSSTVDVTDSTGVNNGTNTSTTAGAGQIGGAIVLSGSSQYVTVPDSASLRVTGALTLQAWVKPTDRANYNGIISKTDGTNPTFPNTWDMFLFAGGGASTVLRGNGSGGSGTDYTSNGQVTGPATGLWSAITATVSGSAGGGVSADFIIYANGSSISNTSHSYSHTAGTGGTGAVGIGTRNDHVTMFKGSMDEVRISNIARGADWIATEYNNQSATSTFYTIGSETGANNTFTASSGTMTVGGALNVTNGTFDLNTNDPTTAVTGAVTIGGTLLASNSANFSFGGNFTNNGTFTHNSGTVTFSPPTPATVTVSGSSVSNFYNFSATTQGSGLKFKASQNTGFAGAVTMTGADGNPIYISSDTAGNQWTLNLSGTATLSYVTVRDSGCAGGTGNVTLTATSLNEGNNGTCWLFISFGNSGNGASLGGGSGGGTPVSGGGSGGGGVTESTDITFDATANSFGSGSTRSINFTTGSGSDRILVVGIVSRDGTDSNRPITSVTYNNVALTQVRSDNNDSYDLTSDLWYLVNPPSGTYSLVVNWTGSVGSSLISAVSYTGVDQSSPIGASAGTTGNSGTTLVDITTNTARSMLVDTIYHIASTLSPANSQTVRAKLNGGDCVGMSDKLAIESGATTMSWNTGSTGADYWESSVVALNPVNTDSGSSGSSHPYGITFDAATNSGFGSGASRSMNFTVGTNQNRILIVGAVSRNGTNSNRPVTSVTYNNVALTKIRADNNDSTSLTSELWYLVNPASGTNSIVVNWTGSVGSSVIMAVSYNNVDQTSPIDAQNGGITSSLSITTVNGNDLLVDSLYDWITGIAAGSDQVTRNVINGGDSVGQSDKEAINPGTATMYWDGAQNRIYSVIALKQTAASQGGGGGATP